MEKNGSGVILVLTANAAREAFPGSGGFGVACAALESLCRQLAVEAGPAGIRVVCLRSAGSPDAPGVAEALQKHAASSGVTKEAFEKAFADKTMLKRLPKLAEVANIAVLMACDHASPVTAAVINVTCGEMAD
jgi:enoyl-[acyl-carrier-protein] reductase (NADH)